MLKTQHLTISHRKQPFSICSNRYILIGFDRLSYSVSYLHIKVYWFCKVKFLHRYSFYLSLIKFFFILVQSGNPENYLTVRRNGA